MKNFKKQSLMVAGVSFAGVSVANAALPPGATAAFTQLQTDGLALIDAAWPVVTALTVGFIIISLFKKAAAKAV